MNNATGDAPAGGSGPGGAAPRFDVLLSPLALAFNLMILGGWVVLSLFYISAMPPSVRPKSAQVPGILFLQALIVEVALVSAAVALVLLVAALGHRPVKLGERAGLLAGAGVAFAAAVVVLLIGLVMTFPQY
jgi:hypothetical protein